MRACKLLALLPQQQAGLSYEAAGALLLSTPNLLLEVSGTAHRLLVPGSRAASTAVQAPPAEASVLCSQTQGKAELPGTPGVDAPCLAAGQLVCPAGPAAAGLRRQAASTAMQQLAPVRQGLGRHARLLSALAKPDQPALQAVQLVHPVRPACHARPGASSQPRTSPTAASTRALTSSRAVTVSAPTPDDGPRAQAAAQHGAGSAAAKGAEHGAASGLPSGPSERSTPAQQHWLDRRWPGAREWLEEKNRTWWLRGVRARCKQHPALQGREQQVGQLVEHNYRAFLDRHRHRAVDERSHTHLQVACLVLATHKVLQPWVRDDQEVLDMVAAHMGEQTSALLRFLLRFTMYLSRNPYATTARRLQVMQLDYGQAFDSSFTQDNRQAVLEVRRCFYHAVFDAEGLPQLTAAACCSLDRVWFDNLTSHGVGFARERWLGAGDGCCRLRVHKLRDLANK